MAPNSRNGCHPFTREDAAVDLADIWFVE